MSIPTSLELTKEEETLAMMANDKHNHPRTTASPSQLEHYRDQQRRSPRLLGQPPGPGLPYIRQQPPSGAVQQSIPVNPWPADQFQLPTAVPERPPTSTATPAIGYNESCFTVPERLPTSTAPPAVGYNGSCFPVPERPPTSTDTPAIGYNGSCFPVPERPPTSTVTPAASKSGSEDELSEEEKRLRRAERFGTCTEADKRAARAVRFGTTPVKKGQKTTKAVSDASASSEEAERRLKRAKRFGLTTPETEAERKRLRAQRFGAN
ncbi:hypothetical protein FOZ60_010816 [Perkinsus olseni]|uniref:THO1-MOS11 C-terminal domain-containing protein n=1 Tax=Perkinsus olseni TaxID=32597 RepID=A0A7J6NEA5_PEROL|nr:hypothetical protein FOZ60_010816 [Perkinsus olseni]